MTNSNATGMAASASPLTGWISDVSPSLPAPPSRPVKVDLGGFAFTTGGIVLPVTDSDVLDLLSTLHAPPGVG